MAHEEQNLKVSTNNNSGGNGGGKSSKMVKQKKIPQRGLGVAQLEKIRLEEQESKVSSSSTIISSSPPTISMPLPSFHHNQPTSLIPFRPPEKAFRNFDTSNTVPLPTPISYGGFEIGWPPVPGLGNIPKLWNQELNQVKNSSLDPGLAFRANLHYESNAIWPLPNVTQNTQQYQQPCSLMVNVSSATSSPSLLNYQMEPPSNQSCYGNYTSMWPEEEKMIGMKRPYPFSPEIPQCPSFNYKMPPFISPISRSDESASCGLGDLHNFNPSSTTFRESTSICTPGPSYKGVKENQSLNGDFLTLGPSKTATALSYNQERFKFESESYHHQGIVEDQISHEEPNDAIQQHLPAYVFFPPAKAQIVQVRPAWNYCDGRGENIDLNLKL